MTHTEQTKLQFIELRAQEKTLGEISSALNVCKRTLVHWNREFARDIADLREVEREALRQKLFGTTHDWMKAELDHYKRLDTEFARREFKYSPTESVFRMRAESRKTIERFLFAESPLDRPWSGGRVVALSTTAGRDGSPICPSSAQVQENSPEPKIDIRNSSFDIPENPSISHPFPHQKQEEAQISPAKTPIETPHKTESQFRPLLRAAETKSLGENDDPRLERGEGQASIPDSIPGHQPSTNNTELAAADLVGSVVIDSDDSAASIVIKYLEAARRSG